LAKWVSDADLLRAIVEETRGLAQGATVVELGCGLGHVAAAFVGVAAKCVGVDYDLNMLKRAVNKEKIHYIHSRIEEISDLSADVVLARNVMHYVAAHELFGAARKILRPEGILVVCQAVPPSTRARPWHVRMHDILGVNHAPSCDDIVTFFHLHGFSDIRSRFNFCRMNVQDWLDARVDSPEKRRAVLEHHQQLKKLPEFEPDFSVKGLEVTVRFVIVSGLLTV
ncbi:MAG: class I SAM-dependent methyltransferase, partial [Deltaproteobacteria bacterium]|nr:class I SAM-dependent methyltransferase [Deltaproteobacteria bacterium]